MSDEYIIKRKLIMDGEGFGEDQRLNVFLKQLAVWVKSNKPPTELEAEYNYLLSQLNRVKLYKKKVDSRRHCNQKQLEKYRDMQNDYEAKNQIVTNNIKKQQKLLDEAKIIRKNHIDRILMVKIINEGPSCKQLMEAVDNLKQEVVSLLTEMENLQSQLNNQVQEARLLSISANVFNFSLQKASTFDDQIENIKKV